MIESSTGGQSEAARQAQNDVKRARADSWTTTQAGRAWGSDGALRAAAALLEGLAQDWRDVANESRDGAEVRARLAELEPAADVELLRRLADVLAWSSGVEAEPCPACEGSGVVAVDLAGGDVELWKCPTCRMSGRAHLADAAPEHPGNQGGDYDGTLDYAEALHAKPADLGGALRAWAEDAVRAYRSAPGVAGLEAARLVSESHAARLVDIARNPDPRD